MPHVVDGCYIGAAPEHYHCHRIFVLQTCKERIVRTVEFFPHYFPMPTTLSADAAIATAQTLVHALQHPKPATPFATVQSDQSVDLVTLSDKNLRRAQSTPLPHLVLTPRVRVLPFPPIIPPRVPVTSPRHPFPTSAPAAFQRLSIIEPDDDDPVRHRYHLQSQINLAKLLPAEKENAVIDSATGNLYEFHRLAHGPDKAIWIKSLTNDLGRLGQGVGSRMTTVTNALYFCHPSQILSDCKFTYEKVVATLQPQKEEEHRVQDTVGKTK